MANMKCAVFYGPMDVRIEELKIPKPRDDEILVKVRAALTCGTILKLKRGAHPTILNHLHLLVMNLLVKL